MLADKTGRKKALTVSIFFMGIGTALIAILPSYEKIGVTSVFLLLFIRVIQVISVGNEYISSVSLLIESCENNRKGYFGSWAAFGVNAGMFIYSLAACLGGEITPLIAFKLGEHHDYSPSFILIIYGALSLSAIVFYVPRKGLYKQSINDTVFEQLCEGSVVNSP